MIRNLSKYILFNKNTITTSIKYNYNLSHLFYSTFNNNNRSSNDDVKPIRIIIPRDKVDLNFSKSSGAGGQNVNKVNTKAEIRFNLEKADWIPDYVKDKLRKDFKKNLSAEGEFYVQSMKHREQKLNLNDCFDKLDEILKESSIIPKERIPTKIPQYAIEKRLRDKAHRKKINSMRKVIW